MKIRIHYVSNSSSSSFIVSEDLNNKGIACLKLNKAQMELINGYKSLPDECINFDLKRDFWLTEYISDCDSTKNEFIYKIEHVFYESGQMCEEPYLDEYYNKYNIGENGVWLRREHDEAKQMSVSQFIKELKNKIGNDKQIIVKYNSQGCEIIEVD